MIIDTTYLLPLARISVKYDLLRAIADGKIRGVDFSDLGVSLISLFELQAKASKLGVNPEYVSKAVKVILRVFRIIPFYRRDIVREAHNLRKILDDYIDCIILATAITLKEDLVTEDSDIRKLSNEISRKYGIRILSYNNLIDH